VDLRTILTFSLLIHEIQPSDCVGGLRKGGMGDTLS